MIELTEVEKKIVTYLTQYGERNLSTLASELKMDIGQLSRYVDVLDEKGAVDVRQEGASRLIKAAEGVTVEGEEIVVPEGVTFPLAERFQDVLNRVLKGKLKKNIPLMVDNFRLYQGYQVPQGLRALLTNWQIDAATQNVIVDSVFPGSGVGMGGYAGYPGGSYPLPTYAPPSPYSGVQTFPGPGGIPIIVLGGGQQGYQQPGQPIIISAGDKNQPVVPPGNTQPIIIETKEKRRIAKPMMIDGQVQRMPRGEKCPHCGTDILCEVIEEPVTVQLQQPGMKSAYQDAGDALERLMRTGKDLGIVPSGQAQVSGEKTAKERELEQKLAEETRRREEAEAAVRKKELEDMRKDVKESTDGLQVWFQKKMEEWDKDWKHRMELMDKDRQIEAARSTGGSLDERIIEKGTKSMKDVVGGSIMDIYKMGQQSRGIPAPPTGQTTTPAEAEAELRRRLGA